MSCDPVAQRLCSVHERLRSLDSLAPSPPVNALFSELVRLCSAGDGDHALRCPHVQAIAPSLRRLCARGEYELEREWARRIIDSVEPAGELQRFPYRDNYLQLVEMEMHALYGLGYTRLRRVAFVGSGPLPLSAILLGRRFGLRVDSVDRQAEAHGLAVKVNERLGRCRSLRFHHRDLLSWEPLEGFDAVFLAALVGSDRREKRLLLAHLAVRMRPGAVLLVRTAHRLRTLLYPETRLEDLSGFVPKLLLHPLGDVINSIIVAERITP
ncbi:MAG: nicotianamine synthase family protein [Egibacteraceae bacterium]